MRQHVTTWGSLLALSLVALACPQLGHAQEAVTVKGEIVDLACYMAKGSKGPTHKACAQMCAKKGLPIGVLTDNEGVFLLLADDHDSAAYESAKKLAGERAEVSGKKFSKDNIVSIAVGSVRPVEPEAAAEASRLIAIGKPK